LRTNWLRADARRANVHGKNLSPDFAWRVLGAGNFVFGSRGKIIE
jgi:hypothetical protein